jgi:hypothetical protein
MTPQSPVELCPGREMQEAIGLVMGRARIFLRDAGPLGGTTYFLDQHENNKSAWRRVTQTAITCRTGAG